MIKAVLGGGGKGMRISTGSNDIEEQIESAKRESLKSFGNDQILLEKYIKSSRYYLFCKISQYIFS
jgi:3-methylcrotonyl-CoA carboxylase alpha subunit